jgi:hypothetical protein
MPLLKSVLVCFGLVISIAMSSFAQAGDARLVGAWRIVAVEMNTADGTASPLYRGTVGGIIVYDPSGKMSGHLMDLDVPRCGTMDRRKCPDAAARTAFDNYIGYWGRYEVLAGEDAVIHHVEGASHPDWIGSDQKRFFRFSGNRIIITTPPQMIRGVESVVTVTAERL